jgi:hypothetical protein
MAANSFTWSLTTAGSSGTFQTAANWVSVNNGDANIPSFGNGGDDFGIITAGSVSLTVTGFGGLNIDALTISDAGATLVATGAQNIFNSSLTLNSGVIDANFDGGSINVGHAANGGSIVVGGTINAGGVDFDNNYEIQGVGTPPAALTGSGTIIANGYLQMGSNVAASDPGLTFQVADNGNALDGSDNTSFLEFDGNVNSGSVDFLGASGYLVLVGTQVGNGATLSAGGTFGATVTGMTVGSSVDNTNVIEIATNDYNGPAGLTATFDTSTDILALTDSSSNTYDIQLVGSYAAGTAAEVQLDGNLGGFDVFLVCYGAGTAILTDRGEAAVETIEIGDTVMTLVDGVPAPRTVKWVGHRDLDLSRHPKREAVAPIRITRGALGENLPHRDLIVSPDHCLFIDGGLYPAKLLVNDMTIVRDLTATAVTYHHVELERHAVMIAEGVPAESYLDTGNRAFFSNAGLATVLHPELNINESLRCWETDACAPLTVKPELVKPVWQRFADRAVVLGYSAPVYETTRDAGIHLVVDGKIVRPLVTEGKTVTFMVPGKADSVRLVSRATRPSALTPWLDDPRTLGVAISSVTLRDPSGESVMNADHPSLRNGWHAPEYMADGTFWRWSAGDAVLPFVTSGPCTVEIALSGTTTYIERETRLAA